MFKPLEWLSRVTLTGACGCANPDRPERVGKYKRRTLVNPYRVGLENGLSGYLDRTDYHPRRLPMEVRDAGIIRALSRAPDVLKEGPITC
jgi:hypothetical protein